MSGLRGMAGLAGRSLRDASGMEIFGIRFGACLQQAGQPSRHRPRRDKGDREPGVPRKMRMEHWLVQFPMKGPVKNGRGWQWVQGVWDWAGWHWLFAFAWDC